MIRGILDDRTSMNFVMQIALVCLFSVTVSHSAILKSLPSDLSDMQWISGDTSIIDIKERSPIANDPELGVLNVKYDWRNRHLKRAPQQVESMNPSEDFGSSKQFPCPEAADIIPCVCTEFASQLDLQCYNVNSEDELKSVFLQEFPARKFTNLHIMDSPAIQTLGDIFNGVSFEYVLIETTGLKFFSEYFLVDSLDTLVSLTIIDSKITSKSFPFLSLDSYKSLANLYIRGHNLTYLPVLRSSSLQELQIFVGPIAQIEPDALQGLPNVQLVNFDSSHLTSLPKGVTSDLPRLSTANFLLNQITTIGAGVFDFSATFFSINLSFNQISVIEPGAFVLSFREYNGTAGFFDIDLSNNLLTTLDEEVFGDVFWYLDSINLTSNPLTCGCDLSWLVLNSHYLSKLHPDTACYTGTLLIDLDPHQFELFC